MKFRLADLGDVAASLMRTVSEVASNVLPEELAGFKFDAASIANVVLLADRHNMLNDPAAKNVKKVADQIASGKKVSNGTLLALVPDILELELVGKVMPGVNIPTDAARKVILAYRLAATGKALNDAVTGGNRPRRTPEPEAPAAEAADGPQGDVVEAAAEENPARTPRRRAPRRAATPPAEPDAAAPDAPAPVARRRTAAQRRQAPPAGAQGVE